RPARAPRAPARDAAAPEKTRPPPPAPAPAVSAWPLYTTTRGAPPSPAPRTTSANPSPFTSPEVIQNPLRSSGANPKKSPKSRAGAPLNRVRPSYPATRGPPPSPAVTSRSGVPSAFTSPAAGRSPPRTLSSRATKLASAPPVRPSISCTTGPPPVSGVTARSGTLSPLKSAAVTNSPPRKAESSTSRLSTGAPLFPSKTRTTGPPPGPGTVMTSGIPSRVRSAVATRTPPVKSPNGRNRNRSLPAMKSNTRRHPPPTASAAAAKAIARTAGAPNAAKFGADGSTGPGGSGGGVLPSSSRLLGGGGGGGGGNGGSGPGGSGSTRSPKLNG